MYRRVSLSPDTLGVALGSGTTAFDSAHCYALVYAAIILDTIIEITTRSLTLQAEEFRRFRCLFVRPTAMAAAYIRGWRYSDYV